MPADRRSHPTVTLKGRLEACFAEIDHHNDFELAEFEVMPGSLTWSSGTSGQRAVTPRELGHGNVRPQVQSAVRRPGTVDPFRRRRDGGKRLERNHRPPLPRTGVRRMKRIATSVVPQTEDVETSLERATIQKSDRWHGRGPSSGTITTGRGTHTLTIVPKKCGRARRLPSSVDS